MADIIDFPPMKTINDDLDRVECRAHDWWCGTDFPKIIANMPLSNEGKDLIERIAKHAWVEGAVTSVCEYGDELRVRGILPPKAEN